MENCHLINNSSVSIYIYIYIYIYAWILISSSNDQKIIFAFPLIGIKILAETNALKGVKT